MKVALVTSRAWNEWLSEELRSKGHEVLLVNAKEQLTKESLSSFKPKYVFIPHWSHLIKPDVYENFECIIFHMTDLPYGRGGSPLQNLIVRGNADTVISAIRCTDVLDGGPVYLKKPLSLQGSADEIFQRASKIILTMINEIIEHRPRPVPQSGQVVEFIRRTPEQSDVSSMRGAREMYDLIRMLDADGYPKAFLEHRGFRYEFSRATLHGEEVTATVRIKRIGNVPK